MLKVTNIDLLEKSESTIRPDDFTEANEAIIGGARRYEDQASGIRAQMALS